jgi:hypothetical protein
MSGNMLETTLSDGTYGGERLRRSKVKKINKRGEDLLEKLP